MNPNKNNGKPKDHLCNGVLGKVRKPEMNDRCTIETNLRRAVVLGMIAIVVVLFYYWIDSNTGTLIVLIMLVGIFSQYVFSKQIFRIIVDLEEVKFEYLQLQKKTISYERDLIKIKERTEVHFRGGKNEIFEIYDKTTRKMIFKISKRSFKSENDYFMFKETFKNND